MERERQIDRVADALTEHIRINHLGDGIFGSVRERRPK